MKKLAYGIYNAVYKYRDPMRNQILTRQRITVAFSDEDFTAFMLRMRSNLEDVNDIVESYRLQYAVSKDEIHALLLMKFFKYRDLGIHEICPFWNLFRDFEFRVSSFSSLSLIMENEKGENAITLGLERDACTMLLSLTHEPGKENRRCYIMSDKVLTNIVYQFGNSKIIYDMHPLGMVRQFIKPFYEKEDVKRLLNDEDLEWLNWWYI